MICAKPLFIFEEIRDITGFVKLVHFLSERSFEIISLLVNKSVVMFLLVLKAKVLVSVKDY